MTSREIGFGLYDVRRPATSPTRRGAAKGRPQPGRGGCSAPHRPPVLTPSPPRGLAHSTPHLSSAASVDDGYAAVQHGATISTAAAAAGAVKTNESVRAVQVGGSVRGAGHEATAAVQRAVRPSPSPSPPPRLSPIPPETLTTSPPSSSYVEASMRAVVNLTAAPVLLAPLLEILHRALREVQHERHQRKGQEPRRRPSSLTVVGADLEREVVACLATAAQSASVTAAADVLHDFLLRHSAAAAPPSSVVRPTPTSSSAAPAVTCSPVVLIGATLAELVVVDRVTPSVMSTSAVLSYLDAAVSAGHSGAMLCVGLCLRDGRVGVHRDVAAGLAWLRCAAAAGFVPAMVELGETYELGVAPTSPAEKSSTAVINGADAEPEEGMDGAVDWGEAMRWYRLAAEAGHTGAQLNLGKLLLLAAEQAALDASADTAAVAHLSAEATRWLQLCAEAGVQEAVRLQQRVRR